MTRAEKRYLRQHRTIKNVLMMMLAEPSYNIEEIAKYHPMMSMKSLEETRKALVG